MRTFAVIVEIATTLLALAAMAYSLLAFFASWLYLVQGKKPLPAFAPPVTLLKPVKGLDPAMVEAFRSHCRQTYPGPYEILFGVSSLDDPAVPAVHQLQAEFPSHAIRLVLCPEVLGANGKVSNLIQMVPEARHDYLIVNDSDITVSPRYLERVMACFALAGNPRKSSKGTQPVGLVTALYRGRAHATPQSPSGTLPSRLEALGIATDFQAGVLTSRFIEGGIHFGLGSTLAVSRAALDAIGGFPALVDRLADDYELGARIHQAGYRIALSPEIVETAVPAYNFRGFFDHQLRWVRTVRDARPGGYIGLLFTYGLPLALANVLAAGAGPVSIWLLILAFFLRLALAFQVGGLTLRDRQLVRDWWLLPLRDALALAIWIAGFAGNTILWRGHRFRLKRGRLIPTK